jgi:hypothetical protein
MLQFFSSPGLLAASDFSEHQPSAPLASPHWAGHTWWRAGLSARHCGSCVSVLIRWERLDRVLIARISHIMHVR